MEATSYFKQLTILHLALTGGATLVLIVLYFLAQQGFASDPSLAGILLPIAVVVGIGGIAAGSLLYRRGLTNLRPEQPLSSRLGQYRGLFILRMALTEAGVVFGGVTYLLSAALGGLLVGVALLGWMVMLRPGPDDLATALHLRPEERPEVLGSQG